MVAEAYGETLIGSSPTKRTVRLNAGASDEYGLMVAEAYGETLGR